MKEKERIHFRQEKELLKIKVRNESCFHFTTVSLTENLETFRTIDFNHNGERLIDFTALKVSFSHLHQTDYTDSFSMPSANSMPFYLLILIEI